MFRTIISGAVALCSASVGWTQPSPPPVSTLSSQEIVVTGTRREMDSYDAQTPAVGLRKVADFVIQPVVVTGDAREPDQRHEEMYQTIRKAIEQASSHGVVLSFGDVVVEPLTLANYRSLTLDKDSRPDTNRVELLVKAPLSVADARQATGRIDRFIKELKPVGRALLEPNGDMTLSVVGPDQYRPEIVRLVAADAAAMAGKFGTDYAVEVKGLNRPVEWSRASLTEVMLYIPYELAIRPKS